MLKARGKTGTGEDLVFLGLSGENVTRLAAGEPLTLNLAELDLPATQLVIVQDRRSDQEAARG